MTAFADFDDVVDRWIGGGLPADESQITTLLEDASDVIRKAFPDVDSRISDSDVFARTVGRIASNMVIRYLRNPTGQRSVTQGAGAFQQSVTYGGDNPGQMSLTDAERAELAGPKNLSGKAFSADMTPASFVPLDDEALWTPAWIW